MLLCSKLLFVRGALTRVLDGQCRGQDHDFGSHAALIGLNNHPSQPWVHRQLRKLTPHAGDAALGVHRTQLAQQCHAVGDGPGIRWLDERELLNILGPLGHTHGRHLENDGGQVGAQDFRIGEFTPGVEVLLGVQPDADTVRDTPATARTLVGRSL